jgi:hypothetical protein
MDYGEAISAVRALGLKEDAQEQLLSGAARKVFKLDERVRALD